MITISPAFDAGGAPRKPGALCIGAQKAGTSWLAQMLGQHPQIWIPPFKEVQFFNHRFIPEHRKWIGWHYRNKPAEIRDRHAARNQIRDMGAERSGPNLPGQIKGGFSRYLEWRRADGEQEE